jgi:hypothetical protein
MEERFTVPAGPGPRSWRGIMAQALHLYLHHIGPVTAIAAIVAVPLVAAGRAAFGRDYFQLAAGMPLPQADPLPQALAAGIAIYALLYLVGLLAISGAVAEVIARSLAGHELCVGRAYVASVHRLPHMLGASVVAALAAGLPAGIGVLTASSVGIALAGWIVIALMSSLAVYVFVRFAFVTYIALLEQKGPYVSLARSWSLTSGAWWRTFGLLALITLLVGVVQIALDLATGSLPELSALLSIVVVTPLTVIGNALIYLDLRARKEDYTLEGLDKDLRAITDG